jgi:hypothetical protein
MAVEMASATTYDIRIGKPGQAKQYNVLTIQEDADRYSALCQELGIASDGETAMQAAINVQRAVLEALAVAEERGISAGEPFNDAAVLEFMQNHRGPDPMTGYVFTI